MLSMKKTSAPSWLVCFLGNPGSQYEKTRHNAGWMVSDVLDNRYRIKTSRLKFKAFTCIGELGGEKVFFMRPQTYMNLSGEAVGPAAHFYKIPPQRCIVIQDDTALPAGRLRVKRGGSDGGHNGIKSIISALGTTDFPRVKIGVGAPEGPEDDRIDWVIGRLTDEEYERIYKAAEVAADAAEEIIRNGVDSAMNKYNAK